MLVVVVVHWSAELIQVTEVAVESLDLKYLMLNMEMVLTLEVTFVVSQQTLDYPLAVSMLNLEMVSI